MGSLMSGWDSPTKDPNTVRRCKSLTREEIDAFWKSKKKTEEEHVQAVSKLVTQEVAESQGKEDPYENQIKKSGWWRRSNLAFLNEPREEEGRPNNYVPQFQVAHIAKIAG
ncbi:DNA polymerase epsilon catalytic subunit A [Hirschfeldia incana]|nr:DNA polymerase epsilon catalytic subunit A [Hirschfeldia incana]